jgi:hypothetical protein
MTDLESKLCESGENARKAFDAGWGLLEELDALSQIPQAAALGQTLTNLKDAIRLLINSMLLPALFADAEFRALFLDLYNQLKRKNPSATGEDLLKYAMCCAHNGIVFAHADGDEAL